MGVKNFNDLPDLKKWVITNKYFIKTNDSKELKKTCTHYLLDGGIWKIPLNEYQTFLKLLSDDLQKNEKYYISENRSEIFRFVCDLDFYDTHEISIDYIIEITKKFEIIIQEYYSISFGVIICGTEPKNSNNGLIKTGFHLIYPKLWISQVNAKKLRIKFIEILKQTFDERHEPNTWEDVVDLAIYENNGLRMVGCRKIGICKTCKGKDQNCIECDGKGKKDEGRVYKPVCTLNLSDEYTKSIKTDLYIMLLETSIINYLNYPETPLSKNLEVSLPTINKRVILDNQSHTITKIENFIKKAYKSEYPKVRIKKVTKVDTNKYYIEPYENYCMNVGRCHTSSGIYFQIQKNRGISQRCFCKKLTLDGRFHGFCKDYCSKDIPISIPLNTFLFGKDTKKLTNVLLVDSSSNTLLNNRERNLNACKSILQQLEYELLKIT